jgi:hypothetical protein
MKFELLHHADQKTIDEMYNTYTPVFILSTGRSGSKFIANLLDWAPNISAFHEPRPTLEYFSNYAYHHREQKEILSKMIDSARMESILEIFIKDKIYVESNQCVTFFAPAIAELFKKSKFVHITRHPGDFIRSAVRKGWHKNDSIWESGRIKTGDRNRWAGMDQIERLAWLWNSANRFIEDFKGAIEKKRTAFFKFEDLTSGADSVHELLHFIGGQNIPNDKIKELQGARVNELYIGINEPPNMKKVESFPHYNEWEQELKDKVKKHTLELVTLYKYKY